MGRRALAVIAVTAACCLPGAQAADPAPAFGVAGGTWTGQGGVLLGPAWEMDAPTESFGATVSGPDGFTRRIGGAPQRFIGMPATRALHWCNPEQCKMPAAAAAWTATGDDKSQVAFTIDPASRLTTVVLDRTTFQNG